MRIRERSRAFIGTTDCGRAPLNRHDQETRQLAGARGVGRGDFSRLNRNPGGGSPGARAVVRCAGSGLASLSDARFQNGKKPMPPPVFCKRVRKRLKAKSLERKTEYTENGRVRKSMSRKGLILEASGLKLGAGA